MMLSDIIGENEPSELKLLFLLDQAKKTTKKEQSQPSFPLRYISPTEMLTKVTISGPDEDRRKISMERDVRTIYIGQKIEYSTRSLNDLKPSKDNIWAILIFLMH
jgi:hypothetical protein